MDDPSKLLTIESAELAIAAYLAVVAEHPDQPGYVSRRVTHREATRAIEAVPDASEGFRLWFKLMMGRNGA